MGQQELRVELLVDGEFLVVLPSELDEDDLNEIGSIDSVNELQSDDGWVVLVRFSPGEGDSCKHIIAFLNNYIRLTRSTANDLSLVSKSLPSWQFDRVKNGIVWASVAELPNIVSIDDVGTGIGNEVLVVRGSSGFEIVRIESIGRGATLHDPQLTVRELHRSYPSFDSPCSLGVSHEHGASYFGMSDKDEFPRTFAVRNYTEDHRRLVAWMLDSGREYDQLATKIIQCFPEDFVELRVDRSHNMPPRIIPVVTL